MFAPRALVVVPLVAAAAAGTPDVAPAQVYTFDNVVMLANEDPLGGAPNDLVQQYMDCWGFVGNDGREYVILAHRDGTMWWDVEDPVHPVLVKDIPGPNSTHRDIFVLGDHAYASSENANGGVQIFDISDPTDPVAVGAYTATVGQAHNLFGDPARNLLYVVGGQSNGANGGLQILDATDPLNLVEIGQWSNQYIHDISVEGTVVHANLINTGRFRLIDVSDSTDPKNLGSQFVDPTGNVHASWPLGDGVHVLMCEETSGGHLKSLDVSNPSSISLVDSYNPFPTSSAHNVHVQGTRAYVSWYVEGLRILDVSNPAALTEIGFFDTLPGNGQLFSGNWGVYPHLPSGIIAASDRSHGLFLLQYDSDAATIEGTLRSDVDGPIPGETVRYLELDNAQITDGTGAYRFSAFPGTHTFTASAFGHDPDTISVTVGAGQTLVTDIVLMKQPAGVVSGTITDAVSGLPLEAVETEITVQGQTFTDLTDAGGNYAFPALPAEPVQLRIARYGYAARQKNLTIPGGGSAVENLALVPAAIALDFSSAGGWTVEAETLGTFYGGLWENGVPPTMTIGSQPTVDHTLDPEDKCFVTGLASTVNGFVNAVHGGRVTLTSPVYDLSSMSEPHVSYFRWFWTSHGDNEWRVEASGDGAVWVEIERTSAREAAWVGVDVDLTQHLGTFGAMQIRFIAEDVTGDENVEAGLDDLTIYDAAESVVGAPAVESLALSAVTPNPFREATSFRLAVPAAGRASVSVFDVRGARVRRLVDGTLPAGDHVIPWDGLGDDGRPVSAGVYFVRLEAGDRGSSTKVVRLR